MTEPDDFREFMRTRERAARAYVEGDGGPVDAPATDTAPASFFGRADPLRERAPGRQT